MKAAKRKTFWLCMIASAVMFCAPIVASGDAVLISKTRAEFKTDSGQNRVSQSPFYSVKRDVKYDWIGTTASESSVAPNSGKGLIGLVKPGGTLDDTLKAHYLKIVRSPQMAAAVERYNNIARFLGQKPSASIDEIAEALGNDVTFAKIGHLRSGVFESGHAGTTRFWLQGNPATAYGQRVGRHELTHIGAALRGQGDTIRHEIAVQLATTPENLVAATVGFVVIIGGEVYWITSQ